MSISDIKWRGTQTPFPAAITEPRERFSNEGKQLIDFIGFVTFTVHHSDEATRDLTSVLREQGGDAAEQEYLEVLEMLKTKGAGARFKQHLKMWFQMLFCRQVDNYLAYVSELLALVFRTRPEMLKSSESIKIADVLKHSSMDAVISDLTDRRVNSLSYRGMKDLAQYLEKRLGFALFKDAAALATAVEIVEYRNLIIHNRGVVNQLFLSRVANTTLEVGQPAHLTMDAVFGTGHFLTEAAFDADTRAITKWTLPSRAPARKLF